MISGTMPIASFRNRRVGRTGQQAEVGQWSALPLRGQGRRPTQLGVETFIGESSNSRVFLSNDRSCSPPLLSHIVRRATSMPPELEATIHSVSIRKDGLTL